MSQESFLLDTHALIWYDQPGKIPTDLQRLLEKADTTVFVSSVTAWEISIKSNLGKLEEANALISKFEQTLATYGFLELPFTIKHGLMAGTIQLDHKDPFDKALIAQAVAEELTLVSIDPQIHKATSLVTGLSVLWKMA
jgi:PIN domain nuclease of toxin-antitoxin system